MLINKSTTAGAKYLNILDIVALLSAPGVGRHAVQQIFNTYRGIAPSRPQELHALLLDTMSNTPGARIPTETEVEKAYKNAERVLENAKRLGIQVLTPDNRDFPNGLRSIPDPPVVLYVSGNT